MILHIFHDTNFLKLTQQEFSYCQSENVFVVLGRLNEERNGVKHLTSPSLIEFIQKNSINQIIIHYLTGDKAETIVTSKYAGNIHWSVWGNDIYHNGFGFSDDELYDQQTKNYLSEIGIPITNPNQFLSISMVKKIGFWVYYLRHGKHHPSYWVNLILPKITSFSTVIPTEQKHVSKLISNAKYKGYTYGNLSNLIPKEIIDFNSKNLGNKIAVGNSAAYANNHISVLEKLSDFNLLIPFTYGDNTYKSDILKKHAQQSNFDFMTSTVPYTDYVSKLSESNTMVINTHRQQAVGTILIGIYLGMRVYLNAKNPTLQFLKGLGVHVFDFWQDFDTFKNTPLSATQVSENRKGIESYWGEATSVDRMKKFDL